MLKLEMGNFHGTMTNFVIKFTDAVDKKNDAGQAKAIIIMTYATSWCMPLPVMWTFSLADKLSRMKSRAQGSMLPHPGSLHR